MAVDERRGDEPRRCVDRLGGVEVERRPDRREAAALDGEVDQPPVEQAGVSDYEIGHSYACAGRAPTSITAPESMSWSSSVCGKPSQVRAFVIDCVAVTITR